MRRGLIWSVVAALTLASCGGADDAATRDELPAVDVAEFEQLLAESDRPMVVNFWASWCVPCRSEAPLLAAAHAANPDVRFIGIASDDTQSGAAGFLAEFDIDFENYFDAPGRIKGSLGGTGLPLTVFVASGGEVIDRHFGVIDDQTLALGIDELLRR